MYEVKWYKVDLPYKKHSRKKQTFKFDLLGGYLRLCSVENTMSIQDALGPFPSLTPLPPAPCSTSHMKNIGYTNHVFLNTEDIITQLPVPETHLAITESIPSANHYGSIYSISFYLSAPIFFSV